MTEHAAADNPHTRKIAEFVSALTYEQIPAEVRERIKLLILDSLGCAHLRRQARMVPHPAGRRSRELDATRTTSVWGTELRALLARMPRWSTAPQVQGFELDDVHRVGRAACAAPSRCRR